MYLMTITSSWSILKLFLQRNQALYRVYIKRRIYSLRLILMLNLLLGTVKVIKCRRSLASSISSSMAWISYVLSNVEMTRRISCNAKFLPMQFLVL